MVKILRKFEILDMDWLGHADVTLFSVENDGDIECFEVSVSDKNGYESFKFEVNKTSFYSKEDDVKKEAVAHFNRIVRGFTG